MNYQRVSEVLVSDHPLLFYHAVAYDHFFRISEVVAYEIFHCILSTTTKISFSFSFQSFPTVFRKIFSNTTRANHKIKFLWEKAKHKSVYMLVLPWVSRARKKWTTSLSLLWSQMNFSILRHSNAFQQFWLKRLSCYIHFKALQCIFISYSSCALLPIQEKGN